MRISMTHIAGLALVIGGLIFAVTFARALFISSPEDTAPVPVSQVAPGDYPVRLKIPSLGIDANVQQTGLTKSGAMGVPTNFTDAAWYKNGPLPGEVGSAVMDGHVDNGLSLPGVFKHLGDLKVGDDIYVTTKSGKELHFTVEETANYPYNDVPTERIFTRADRPRLNLITCDGKWIRAEKTYDERLVVYAVLKI